MKILYFGLNPPAKCTDKEFIHIPLIETKPRLNESSAINNFFLTIDAYQNIIITSKECARYFFQALKFFNCDAHNYHYFSIGKNTTHTLESLGAKNIVTATTSTQEGIIQVLEERSIKKVAYPHSSLSRKKIADFCKEHAIDLLECILYDTFYKSPDFPINLDFVDGLYFSSPSTVQSFSKLFSEIPSHLKIYVEGPITFQEVENHYKDSPKFGKTTICNVD